jgi:hypothetical protein
VIKIENEEQPILRLYANFKLDQSVYVRTGAKKYAHAAISSKKCTIQQPEEKKV